MRVCGCGGSLSTSAPASLKPYERGTPDNSSGCCLSLIASPHTLITDQWPAPRLDAYQIPGPALRRNGQGSNRPSDTHYSVVGFLLSNANRLLACCIFTLPSCQPVEASVAAVSTPFCTRSLQQIDIHLPSTMESRKVRGPSVLPRTRDWAEGRMETKIGAEGSERAGGRAGEWKAAGRAWLWLLAGVWGFGEAREPRCELSRTAQSGFTPRRRAKRRGRGREERQENGRDCKAALY